MRAFMIKGNGPDAVKPVDLPEPRPGPGQVLVRVRAASLNYRDLMIAGGRYGPGGPPADLIPLSDGAGEVVEVGGGVTRVKAGDRVAGIFMQGWVEGRLDAAKSATALGGSVNGVLAEYAVFDQQGLVHVPAHLTFEEAATLPCAAVTAWNALFVSGAVKAGDVVLVQGTGGVSVFAAQFANAAGARVLATSSNDEKLARLNDLVGADGVNYRANSDWDRWAVEATGGVGVDHVVEVGGPGTLGRSLNAVRIQGEVSMIGVLTGVGGDVPTAAMLMKHVRVLGIYVGSRAMFEDMNRAIALHRLRPVIDRVFPFEAAADAYGHLASGRHFGKVVVAV